MAFSLVGLLSSNQCYNKRRNMRGVTILLPLSEYKRQHAFVQGMQIPSYRFKVGLSVIGVALLDDILMCTVYFG
ncbi:MAG: hypothetical protein ACI9SK_001145 [Zhongshania sp.]|jgi:hypothetical protein